jgi:hypothetical protein
MAKRWLAMAEKIKPLLQLTGASFGKQSLDRDTNIE